MFEVLNSTFPKPDILVYLHRSVDNLLKNIKKRGRQYETDISAAYLSKIQNVYFEYFRTENTLPIVIVDLEDIDFYSNPDSYKSLVDVLNQKYKVGITRVTI
jgi:deoxyadenosine/deoxycytidine kinase